MKARALRSTILVSQKVPVRRRAGQPVGSRPDSGGVSGSGPEFPAFRLLSVSSGAAIAGPPVRVRGEPLGPGRPAHTGRPRLAALGGGVRAPDPGARARPTGRTGRCGGEGAARGGYLGPPECTPPGKGLSIRSFISPVHFPDLGDCPHGTSLWGCWKAWVWPGPG